MKLYDHQQRFVDFSKEVYYCILGDEVDLVDRFYIGGDDLRGFATDGVGRRDDDEQEQAVEHSAIHRQFLEGRHVAYGERDVGRGSRCARSRYSDLISKIASISTAAPVGSAANPTALRAW